jgi:hypothetical protein
MDMDTYCYKEETGASDTIPGVETTYRSHNIVIEILDAVHLSCTAPLVTAVYSGGRGPL